MSNVPDSTAVVHSLQEEIPAATFDVETRVQTLAPSYISRFDGAQLKYTRITTTGASTYTAWAVCAQVS